MEFLRRLAISTRDQLSGLTVSQRLVIGLCAVLVAGSMAWLMHWAGAPEMVPLFDGTVTQDEATPIVSRLQRTGAKVEYRNDQIYVAAGRQYQLYAMLAESQALPADATFGFSQLLEESSPFTPQDELGRRWNLARQNEVAKIISSFRGVLRAKVMIDPTSKRGLGAALTMPTASVFLTMEPSASIDRKLVAAVAAGVAGTHAALTADNVTVIDTTTGRHYSPPDPSDPDAHEYLERRQGFETYFANQIREQFDYIPGIKVVVHTELVTDRLRRESTTYTGEPSVISQSTRETTDITIRQPTGPGVVPNSAAALSGGTPTEDRQDTESETEFGTDRDKLVESTQNLLFVPKKTTAALNLPRSYFVEAFASLPGATDPPDATAQQAYIDGELIKIRDQVMTIIDAPSDDQVVVALYDGPVMAMGGIAGAPGVAGAGMAGQASNMVGYVKAYGGQVGLGALAVISLLMMLMVVRKASEGTPPPEPVEPVEEPDVDEMGVFATGSAPIGQAAAPGGLLVGQEVDEGTLRTREIVEQLGQMITDNPETAADLVQRWATRES